MRITRIYYDNVLASNTTVTLSKTASNHLLKVLRLKPGAVITLFNGQQEYRAVIQHAIANGAELAIQECLGQAPLSTFHIHLAQSVIRLEKMDWVIQKAVELGVHSIVPLFTERCEIKLSGERLTKRLQHWQAIMISACEQCGRIAVPQLHPAQPLAQWASQDLPGIKLVLDPTAQQSLVSCEVMASDAYLIIGPEGGLAENELTQLKQARFQGVRLGPRILRTETAPLAAITALQCRWGDFQ